MKKQLIPATNIAKQLNVAVLIFNGVELIDMNGPIDVFLHANRFYGSLNPPYIGPAYNVFTVAQSPAHVVSENSTVTMVPGYAIGDAKMPDPNIVVIPGCISLDGTNTSITAPQPVINYLKLMAQSGKTILSVCVGLYSFAATGLLSGKHCTTHYQVIAYIQKKYPDIKMVKNVRYCYDLGCVAPDGSQGLYVTSGGITSGIDSALFLVDRYNGPQIAQATADMMVYTINAPLPPNTII